MITRRRFVAASAAAGASLWLGSCSASARRRRGRVVVVGAGLAGLVAAVELESAGFEVTVLEARDRVGGRCHTWHLGGGQVAEAGGEYIDQDHRVMRALAKAYELPLEDLLKAPDRSAITYFGGVRRPYGVELPASVQAETDRFWSRVAGLAGRPPATLDHMTPADLLDGLGLSAGARHLVEEDIRSDYTVEPDRLSLAFVAFGYTIGEDIPDSGVERFRIRGGNGQLPRALAGELGDLRLRAPVSAVRVSAGGVEVVSPAGRVKADHCLLAAPLPALREVEFTPALPSPWAGAVASMQYGTGSKNAMQYRSRFWAAEGTSGDIYTDLPVGEAWESTNRQRGTRGVLMGYSVARPPLDLQAARADIGQIYPGSSSLFERGRTAAWASERYTGGTYSAWAPGQFARWSPRSLRRPQGRLFMAGEHTDDFAGYMEGAARSGRRAARQISARA